ncbi:Uncharacterised protein [Campylobacter geochelonis]|uniref:Uncharacterized protein n=1 Tax=Campylobacter geochelonis TaxID=1780362 RepID=A0A128EKF7_9BACT|nr:Uncharacterised protein [Campylobacter geochelonis]
MLAVVVFGYEARVEVLDKLILVVGVERLLNFTVIAEFKSGSLGHSTYGIFAKAGLVGIVGVEGMYIAGV